MILDAVAGANLQTALQNLAVQAGTSLDCPSLLPSQQVAALRVVGLQASFALIACSADGAS